MSKVNIKLSLNVSNNFIPPQDLEKGQPTSVISAPLILSLRPQMDHQGLRYGWFDCNLHSNRGR